jgi:hypothetical protein
MATLCRCVAMQATDSAERVRAETIAARQPRMAAVRRRCLHPSNARRVS